MAQKKAHTPIAPQISSALIPSNIVSSPLPLLERLFSSLRHGRVKVREDSHRKHEGQQRHCHQIADRRL